MWCGRTWVTRDAGPRPPCAVLEHRFPSFVVLGTVQCMLRDASCVRHAHTACEAPSCMHCRETRLQVSPDANLTLQTLVAFFRYLGAAKFNPGHIHRCTAPQAIVLLLHCSQDRLQIRPIPPYYPSCPRLILTDLITLRPGR